METKKTPNDQSNLEEEEWILRNQAFWLQTILKSYSHQDSMVQAQKQKYKKMEQQTGSILGNEYVSAVYCHPAYLTYMQTNHVKCQAGWSTSWNQDFWEKY